MTTPAVVLALVCSSLPAWALVPGGGSARSDCYVEWQVTSPDVVANRGRTGIDCQDGDPACDVDGVQNGSCMLGVSICAFQGNIPRCTPREVTSVKLSRRAAAAGVQVPTLPASSATCGPAALVTLPLRRGGKRPSKTVVFRMTARATGKPRKDTDQLSLRCVPNRGAAQCPANPSGGPRELRMSVAPEGADLDNGWTGLSHNFPIVFGTEVRMCLAGCDASTNPACAENQTATDQVNGGTLGPPLPLFAAGVPVCVVNRFASPKLTAGAANIATGVITDDMHLLSDVFLTSATDICPRCSGGDIGATGTCQTGARAGQSCRTEGVTTVQAAFGNKRFTLSSDCVPAGAPAGTLTLTLPTTTGTSTLAGPKPCGASANDNCGAGTCTARCTGPACASTTADGQCIDTKGGVSQVCCSSDTTLPCFPTANGGQIVRTGQAAPPTPPFPDPTYPKTGSGALVATFCEPASGTGTIDVVTGLPGPGALVFPMTGEWIK